MIDSEQLSGMLAEKLGIEAEAAKTKLNELARQIQQIGGEGEELELGDFGRFIRQGGDLSFIPSDQLKTEINHRYAGMKPIELMEGFQEADVSPIERPEENADVKMFEEDADAANTVEMEEISEEASGSEKKQELSAQSDVSKDSGKDAEKEDHQTVYVRSQQSYGWVLVTVMVILALLATWRFASMEGWLSNDSASPRQKTSSGKPKSGLNRHLQEAENSPTTDEERATKPQTAQAGIGSTQTNNHHSQQDSAASVVNTTKQKIFGLMGTVNDSLGRAYMIVVHSLRSQQVAVHEKDSLSKVGYRTNINHATVNGRMQYRVGLGQFQTIKNALDARKKLPNAYKNDNFVTRIK